MTTPLRWPDLVAMAKNGLASGESFDVQQGAFMARGIVAMDAMMLRMLERRALAGSAAAAAPSLVGAAIWRNGFRQVELEDALTKLCELIFLLGATRVPLASDPSLTAIPRDLLDRLLEVASPLIDAAVETAAVPPDRPRG